MSIKLYNGYRLPRMTTMKEFNDFVLRLRKGLTEIRNRKYAWLLGRMATRYVDNLTVLGEEDFIKRMYLESGRTLSLDKAKQRYKYSVPIWDCYDELTDAYWKCRKRGGRYFFDFDFSLVAIPFESGILTLIYCERNEFRKFWNSQPEVEFYGYWNDTDPPEETTLEEWEKRREDWSKVFENEGIPGDVGITIQVVEGVPNFYDLDQETILSSVPTFEQRVRFALDVMIRNREQNVEVDKAELAERVKQFLIPELTLKHFFQYSNELYMQRMVEIR
ncbi:hypothetical protein [Caldibacillus debilis]|uniref:Uncharacterized protein n=1 Tax=Caldibacillus debilis GB1 TaxID=1339248 RepID=A0A420VDL7_9BACI|nr:hypothetical protein [Caldibacillus debilis]RKO61754.1 hypothetical protein Cdeb_01225 [Caldibacillus debilis GB1]